ncbi:transcription termination factor MTERF8, chloroplastic-like isoform X2 [Iris pallida]|uniref:Transcription termination factor MTERF8, chloroplastic-like isoform X2 n=1 Tax=Iris pallida TaxID=29817 RepID=A0AAX6EB51_IRIPA|nr:transcription termination factor MTERF8, chloroplastic-like isoform X2 [Iris pallida]
MQVKLGFLLPPCLTSKPKPIHMMLLLRKNLSTSLPTSFILLCSSFTSTSTPTSTSAAQTPLPEEPPNIITQYLITSHGFPPDRAATASKRISLRASPSQLESVMHFLKHHSFTDAHIRTIILRHPAILSADVAASLSPNIAALASLGLAVPDIPKIVLANANALLLPTAIPRVRFWLAFLDHDVQKLLLALTRNLGLIGYDMDRGVAPKIALLKEYGLSETDIGLLLIRGQGFFRRSISSIEVLMKRALEFGFPRGSPMLVISLSSFSGIGVELLKAKMKLFRSLGWSEEELTSALKRHPFIVRLSEENIREKMEFLVGKAGCTLSYIALRPQLLSYSLERRVIPRYHVVSILKSDGIVERDRDFYKFMAVGEEEFVKRIVMRNVKRVPGLLETYTAACAGKIQL